MAANVQELLDDALLRLAVGEHRRSPRQRQTLLARHATARTPGRLGRRPGRATSDSCCRRAERPGAEPAPATRPGRPVRRSTAETLLVLDGLDIDAGGRARLQRPAGTGESPRGAHARSLRANDRPPAGRARRRARPAGAGVSMSRSPGPAVELLRSRVDRRRATRQRRSTRGARSGGCSAAPGGLAAAHRASRGPDRARWHQQRCAGEPRWRGVHRYELLGRGQQRCAPTDGADVTPVSIEVLAEILASGAARSPRSPRAWCGAASCEVEPARRVDMLGPIRRHVHRLWPPRDAAAGAGPGCSAGPTGTRPITTTSAPPTPAARDLPSCAHAVLAACATRDSRDVGYRSANRIISSLTPPCGAGGRGDPRGGTRQRRWTAGIGASVACCAASRPRSARRPTRACGSRPADQHARGPATPGPARQECLDPCRDAPRRGDLRSAEKEARGHRARHRAHERRRPAPSPTSTPPGRFAEATRQPATSCRRRQP